MPSRNSPPNLSPSPLPTTTTTHHHRLKPLPLILAGSLTFTIALLLLLTILLYRKLYKTRTAPSDLITKSPQHYQCRRFSYSHLRRATNSFSESTHLGHGGFGTVYKATLTSPSPSSSLAVKVMDSSSGSLQGEREFHNELSLASTLMGSPYIVSLLGFSSDRRNQRLILVYELMENRSLQDALLDRRCVELMDWGKRFEIVVDVAKGIEFLHHDCDPCVIHGDIKPSNVLLDCGFRAKIGDFGLARLKGEDLGDGNETRVLIEEVDKRNDDNGSILEEDESVVTVFDEGHVVDLSPENCGISPSPVSVLTESPGAGLSPEVSLEKGSVSESYLEQMSVESGGKQKAGSKRDWWWKQDSNGGGESGSVKDYVMEWIGSEIKKERPDNSNKEWIKNGDGSSSSVCKKKKKRKPREWWKEEFCEELTRKKRKKKKKKEKRVKLDFEY